MVLFDFVNSHTSGIINKYILSLYVSHQIGCGCCQKNEERGETKNLQNKEKRAENSRNTRIVYIKNLAISTVHRMWLPSDFFYTNIHTTHIFDAKKLRVMMIQREQQKNAQRVTKTKERASGQDARSKQWDLKLTTEGKFVQNECIKIALMTLLILLNDLS